METGVALLAGCCVMLSAIVGDVAMALLPTKSAGDRRSTAMPWFQVMFVCKAERDVTIDGLLPRLDSEGRMTLSVGKKSMPASSSAFELVRDMVGEVGGVLNISKSVSNVDMSYAAFR